MVSHSKMKKKFYSIYTAAHNNAVDLLREAEFLFSKNCFARAYVLAFSALEEISKSQLAADVYTGLVDEIRYTESFKYHDSKIDRVLWAYLDANEFLDEDGNPIKVSKPKFKKRNQGLYVDTDKSGKVILPKEKIGKGDAIEIIHIVKVALHQIMMMTEYYGHRIGTKGFMK